MLLGDGLRNQPLEVLERKKVIEIRLPGVSKALVVRSILQQPRDGEALLAIGNDQTDQELFGALPPWGIRATYRVGSEMPVREMVRSLLEEP